MKRATGPWDRLLARAWRNVLRVSAFLKNQKETIKLVLGTLQPLQGQGHPPLSTADPPCHTRIPRSTLDLLHPRLAKARPPRRGNWPRALSISLVRRLPLKSRSLAARSTPALVQTQTSVLLPTLRPPHDLFIPPPVWTRSRPLGHLSDTDRI